MGLYFYKTEVQNTKKFLISEGINFIRVSRKPCGYVPLFAI
jgi:hypothetical protein